MRGVCDPAEPSGISHCDSVRVAFRLARRRRRSESLFRGSIPSLHVPLPTLRLRPRDLFRMTRGQDGSLLLSCVTLSFTTRRRFSPAHRAEGPLTQGCGAGGLPSYRL